MKYLPIFIIFSIILVGCTNKTTTPTQPANDILSSANSCIGCHTNYEALKILADPETPPEDGGGCGGATPYFPPYDRVYMGGSGAEAFLNSSHGKKGCTYCHNGIDNTSDKVSAHSNNFIVNPSTIEDNKCRICHSSIYQRFANSLHAEGWGQKSMVTLRGGFSSFDATTDLVKMEYDKNCGKCHATCSKCHIARPKASGGGLLWGHEFKKTPNMRDNCTACHVSRGGHAYFGEAIGTVPDIHLTKLGNGHCINCHSKNELHGDGKMYDQRYKMPLLPKCENCHTNILTSNPYHTEHIKDLSCQVCHSQDYNNCGSCHVGGDGARIHSYQGFKIGLNPIPETKPYKFTTLRRSLSAPDSFEKWGIPLLANFDVRPTFKYSTPHNIIKWTSRTQVLAGNACYNNCHIIDGRNKELYLYNSDLLDWEINADKNIVVDGKLPAGWN